MNEMLILESSRNIIYTVVLFSRKRQQYSNEGSIVM